jgi:hypothetical protein
MCPALPTMLWSCTAMPSGFATSTIACVIWMSTRDGVGSPPGWLWINNGARYCIDRSKYFQSSPLWGGKLGADPLVLFPYAESNGSSLRSMFLLSSGVLSSPPFFLLFWHTFHQERRLRHMPECWKCHVPIFFDEEGRAIKRRSD